MSRIRIHLDEDCQAHALAKALQQHGIDAKTTNELGLGGVDDERQLEAAHQGGRVLLTNNICDFVPLHTRWLTEGRTHSGILVVPQGDLSVAETVRRLARLVHTLTAEDMVNRLEWLNNWGLATTGT
jgi:predicted nuclease of predicted toxin-antitoxin system